MTKHESRATASTLFGTLSFGFLSSFVIGPSSFGVGVAIYSARSDKVGLRSMAKNLSIAFVRRGYSPTGGAEAYLKRLAHGVTAAGHDAQLIATDDWPDHEWPFGSITRMRAGSVIGFEGGSNCAAVCGLWLGAQRLNFRNPSDGTVQKSKTAPAGCRSRK